MPEKFTPVSTDKKWNQGIDDFRKSKKGLGEMDDSLAMMRDSEHYNQSQQTSSETLKKKSVQEKNEIKKPSIEEEYLNLKEKLENPSSSMTDHEVRKISQDWNRIRELESRIIEENLLNKNQ